MDTNKSTPSQAYIQETCPEVQKSTQTTYGLLRISLVVYGGIIALGFLLTPFAKNVSVPDFAINIFITILTMLALSEIWLRIAERSCKMYLLSEQNPDVAYKKQKDFLLIRFAFWMFPARGIHRCLFSLWFFLAGYYTILCVFGVGVETTKALSELCPGNFLLSFYAVSAACMLDGITKSVFLVRIPGLGGLVAEFANTAIRSDGNIPSKVLDGLIKIFQKISFKKGR